jgi:carboxynorspermidine decarboxylase
MRKEFLAALNNAPNPAYIIDSVALNQNMQLFQLVQKEAQVNILCALKGFSMWGVFEEMSPYLAGATSSSLNEVKLCNEYFKKKAHSCFVVYLDEEFEEVLSLSSHVTFNSLSQYNTFKHYIPNHPEVEFALRVNPRFSPVEVEKYNPCMPASRFGIPWEEMPAELPEGITGIHMHALCECGAEELASLLEECESNIGHLFHQAQWVNLGGGHHITKKGYNVELLIETLSAFKTNYSLDELILEPGEAMGWKTGVLTSKIVDKLKVDGRTIYMLNASFSAHMPDCLEMPYKPGVIGEEAGKTEVILGGNTCMSGDFVDGFELGDDLKVGDTVIFEDMTHYTFVKNTTFNGVPLPSLGKIDASNNFHLFKEFGYEDFKERLS